MNKSISSESDGSYKITIEMEEKMDVPEISSLAMMELKMVARESITYVAGPAAILLQIAHPLVGQGVADHSTFAKRAISRAEYTQMFIYCMIFGTDSEKAAMKDYVDKAHSRVVGGEGKRAYNAQNPELQLWVAATIYASIVGMYELIYGPLPKARAERVYQAFSIMGTSLQLPQEMWPKNLSAFRAYWNDMVEHQLLVTNDARAVFHAIRASHYIGATSSHGARSVYAKVNQDIESNIWSVYLWDVWCISHAAFVFEAGHKDLHDENDETADEEARWSTDKTMIVGQVLETLCRAH
ncbi:uncharacterized protein BHQ10_009935 [Talaromyces amestolkiae]|uniref:ER-bound oxygenase mpaB/mpaB'/Rubber oxygenase catalytic domain-containing protein n=1 Tax=Talaromyces amestolkiae TaxID=1196081 RepID=A0A364LDQ9_TALAM|nr:uncharacterized protein BHQ10_009935 [Talaromyces amestolkiae]RAO73923.1 hypothetical protein BHQ10_009935 [Talaromyces amestolkiae]